MNTPKKKKPRPDCYKCIHRRSIPEDAHSRCNNVKAKVKGESLGIKKGWFRWPFNFDPTWMINCDGFSMNPKDKLPEHKADPLAEIFSMLR